MVKESFKKAFTFNWVARTLSEILAKHGTERALYEVIIEKYVERSEKLHSRNAQAGTSDGVYRYPKI